MTTTMEMLRLAAERSPNFEPEGMRDAQIALVNLFYRCGSETTASDALDGILHCGPDGVMDARLRGIAVRFLSQFPPERLVEDLCNELLQDLDCDDVAAIAPASMSLSDELARDAKAIRGRASVILDADHVEALADDLDAMAASARRLEQRIEALEAQVRAQIAGRVAWRYVHAPSHPNPRHTGYRLPIASGERA